MYIKHIFGSSFVPRVLRLFHLCSIVLVSNDLYRLIRYTNVSIRTVGTRKWHDLWHISHESERLQIDSLFRHVLLVKGIIWSQSNEMFEKLFKFERWKPFKVSIGNLGSHELRNSIAVEPTSLAIQAKDFCYLWGSIHHLRQTSYWFRPQMMGFRIYLSNWKAETYISTYSIVESMTELKWLLVHNLEKGVFRFSIGFMVWQLRYVAVICSNLSQRTNL